MVGTVLRNTGLRKQYIPCSSVCRHGDEICHTCRQNVAVPHSGVESNQHGAKDDENDASDSEASNRQMMKMTTHKVNENVTKI